jgi:hypothetical protein
MMTGDDVQEFFDAVAARDLGPFSPAGRLAEEGLKRLAKEVWRRYDGKFHAVSVRYDQHRRAVTVSKREYARRPDITLSLEEAIAVLNGDKSLEDWWEHLAKGYGYR